MVGSCSIVTYGYALQVRLCVNLIDETLGPLIEQSLSVASVL